MKRHELYDALKNNRHDELIEWLESNDPGDMTFVPILRKAVETNDRELLQALVQNRPSETDLLAKNFRRLQKWLESAVEDEQKEAARALITIGKDWYGPRGFPKKAEMDVETDQYIRSDAQRANQIVRGTIENGWEDLAHRLLSDDVYYPKVLCVSDNQKLIPDLLDETIETDAGNYETILGKLFQEDNIELAKELAEHPRFELGHVREAYSHLIEDGKLAMLRDVLDHFDIGLSQNDNSKALRYAASEGHNDTVKFVAEQGLTIPERGIRYLIEQDDFGPENYRRFSVHFTEDLSGNRTIREALGGKLDIDQFEGLVGRVDPDDMSLKHKYVLDATEDEALALLEKDLVNEPTDFVKKHVFEADEPVIDPERIGSLLDRTDRQRLVFKAAVGRFDHELVDRFQRAGWIDGERAKFFPEQMNGELAEHLRETGATLKEALGAIAVQRNNEDLLDWLDEHGLSAADIPEASYYAMRHTYEKTVLEMHERLDGHPEKQQRLREATDGVTFNEAVTGYRSRYLDELLEKDFPIPDDARDAVESAVATGRHDLLQYMLDHGATIRSTHFYRSLGVDNDEVRRTVVEEYEPGPTMMTRALNRALEDAGKNQRKLMRVAWLAEECDAAEADWSHVSSRGSQYDKKPMVFLFEHYQDIRRHNRRAGTYNNKNVKSYPIESVLDFLGDMGLDLLPDEETAVRFVSEQPRQFNKQDFARRLIDRDVPLHRYPGALSELVCKDYEKQASHLLKYALEQGMDPDIQDGLLLTKAAREHYTNQLELLFEHGGHASLIDREVVIDMAERTLESDTIDYTDTLGLIWADRPHDRPYQLPADLRKRWENERGEELLPDLQGRQQTAYEQLD